MKKRKRRRKRRFPILYGITFLLSLVAIGLAVHAWQQANAIELSALEPNPPVKSEHATREPSRPNVPKPSQIAPAIDSPSVAEPEPEPDSEPGPSEFAIDFAESRNPGRPSIHIESAPIDKSLGIDLLNAMSNGSNNPIAHAAIEEPEKLAIEAKPDPMTRTWSASRGNFNVDAKLIKQTKRSVTLERIDTGKQITILIRRLSKADQQFLKDITEKLVKPTLPVDPSATVFIGTATRVSDGDTIKIHDSRQGEQTIRFLGIDAPEKQQRFGPEARQWLADQVAGKSVRVEVTEKDEYGRWLGNLYVGDLWLNLALVEQGLAWHYVRYSDDARLADAQSEAREKRVGIWQDARRIPPWDYRHSALRP